MSTSSGTWLLIGAGISAGAPSNIPLWGEIAQDTMQFLYRTLEHKIKESRGEGYLLAKEALDLIRDEAYPEVVLECMCRSYGRISVTERLRDLLDPPACVPNACHHAIAHLCKQGLVQGILTTNFDILIEKALDKEDVRYHVITTNTIKQYKHIPIVKAHGTITDSSSLVFMRNEYYMGIPQDVRNMLRSNLKGTTLMIAGYSGNDMDIFPFVRSMIENNMFERVCVVDLVPLHVNKHFSEMGNYIEYYNESAEAYFCRLADISYSPMNRDKRVSSLVPNDHKYPAALFFGDILLQLGIKKNLAFSIFFLTQDIVEEETGDLRQLCISHFAKSIALFGQGNNSWAEQEYSAGRTLLHNILDNINLNKYKGIISEFGRSLASLEMEGGVNRIHGSSGFMGGRTMPVGPDRFNDSPKSIEFLHNVLQYELCARIRACFSALAFASKDDCTAQQRYEMLAVSEKLMYGFNKWESYFNGGSADELPILPVFYSKFFLTFKSFILNIDKKSLRDLDNCICLCRQRGFYIGTIHCYFLKKKYGIELSVTEKEEFESIKKYCGVDEKRMIAPLYQSGSEPFKLSITTYKPPLEAIKNANI